MGAGARVRAREERYMEGCAPHPNVTPPPWASSLAWCSTCERAHGGGREACTRSILSYHPRASQAKYTWSAAVLDGTCPLPFLPQTLNPKPQTLNPEP